MKETYGACANKGKYLYSFAGTLDYPIFKCLAGELASHAHPEPEGYSCQSADYISCSQYQNEMGLTPEQKRNLTAPDVKEIP